MTATTTRRPAGGPGRRRHRRPRPGRRQPVARNPWRHAWFLEGFTWLYLLWSLAPIAVAVLFSFNKGRSQATYQGLSLRWYIGDKSTRCCTTRPCTARSSRPCGCRCSPR